MQTRFDLTQADIPTHWYNLLPDFPEPLPPPLHPGTRQPLPPEALLGIFPEDLVRQEMCPDRQVEIPGEVRDIYALWRPTPLLRAARFERALQTPAHIYYKYEGASPAKLLPPPTQPKIESGSSPANSICLMLSCPITVWWRQT